VGGNDAEDETTQDTSGVARAVVGTHTDGVGRDHSGSRPDRHRQQRRKHRHTDRVAHTDGVIHTDRVAHTDGDRIYFDTDRAVHTHTDRVVHTDADSGRGPDGGAVGRRARE
jgi:hypothetical protein